MVLAFARALGRPVVALGQGVGPLGHPTGRALAWGFFRLVPVGTVRDDGSLAAARAQRAGSGWTRTVDTAFARPHGALRAGTRRTLALAPLFGTRAAGTGVGELDQLWDALVGGVTDAWFDLGLERIEVLAVRTGEREADIALALRIAGKLRHVAPAAVQTFTGSVDDLIDDLGSASIAVCGRYHAFVFALFAGAVPIVLPTHQKLLDTAELVGLPEALVVREATAGAIAKALIAATEFDPHDLAARVSELRRKLARDEALVTRVRRGSTGRRPS